MKRWHRNGAARVVFTGALALLMTAGVGYRAEAFGPPVVTAPPPASPTAPAASQPPPTKVQGPVAAPAPATVAAPVPAPPTSPLGDGEAVVGPSTPPTAPKLAEARLHFQQGVALFRDQNFDAALAEFRGAYGISGEPIVLYNLGLTFKALFRYAEAIDVLDRYLTESAVQRHPVAKERRAEVESLVAEMRSLMADVTIAVKPADATLRIDGRPASLGVEGIAKLPAGTHVIEANAADHMALRREITVVAGTPQTLSLDLAVIPHSGHVTITAAQIGAHVSIDGRDMGAVPVTVELGVGGHQVEVMAPGYMPGRSELAVAAGQSRTVTIVLELPPPPETTPFYHRWWFWGGVGVVAAATVATILLIPEKKQGPLSGTLGIADTTITTP
ncbi:MAG TPA: PEGA domain-containing protein [Polyangia bacterium]|jgi:hypothetical protein